MGVCLLLSHALDSPPYLTQYLNPKRRNTMKNIYRFALMLVAAMFVIGSIGCAKVEVATDADAADATTENADAGADAAAEGDAEK